MVGLKASEQATTAAAASRLAIGLTGPPRSRTRKVKRRAAKGARRARNDIIGRYRLVSLLGLDDDDAVATTHAIDRDVTRILERGDRLNVPRVDPRQVAAWARLDLRAVDDEQRTLGRIIERGWAHHADADTAVWPRGNRHAGELAGEHLVERAWRRLAGRDALDRRGWRRRQGRGWPRRFGTAVTACDAQHSKSGDETRQLVHIEASQNVFAQVLVLDDPQQPLPYRRPVEHDVLGRIVGQLEQHVLEQRREHSVQPPRPDVFHPLVHLRRDARDLLHAVGRELECRAIRRAQRRVLLGQRVLRLRHDAHEVGFGERRQLDPDREAPLQLRNQIARLGNVKCAGGDEQDVIGAHVAVARLHGRAFDDRQQVALHAFARDVGPGALAALAGDLVDLVDEDDAVVLDAVERFVHDVVHVDELLQLFVDQNAARLVHVHGPAFLLFGDQLLNHFAEIDVRPFHPLRRLHHFEHGKVLLLDFDLDVALLQLAVLELGPQLLARAPAPFVGFGLGLGDLR